MYEVIDVLIMNAAAVQNDTLRWVEVVEGSRLLDSLANSPMFIEFEHLVSVDPRRFDRLRLLRSCCVSEEQHGMLSSLT